MRGLYVVLRCQSGEKRTLRMKADALVGQMRDDSRIDQVEVSSGYHFRGEPGVLPPLDHVVLRAWSAEPAALADAATAIDDLGSNALERWDLVVQPTRVRGSLGGFVPDTSGVQPLALDEPAVAHIQAVLTPEGVAPFYEAGSAVAAQALGHLGYLGGVGLTENFVEIASLSCWRTCRDARAYAFSDGHHDRARRQGLTEGWHDSTTECFMRLRPLESTGTLHGSNPFASVLASAPTVASASDGDRT